MNIYLCGPINGCTDDKAMTWRDWFKRIGGTSPFLSINWIDPMKRDYRGKEHEDYREIVELDKREVAMSDAIVVMYTQPSVGTSMEVFFAWSRNIPTIVIDESSKPISPWLRYHATAVVKTKEEAMQKIKEWLI